jgi:hypothetical protein
LMNLLGGFVLPSQGRVLLDGQAIFGGGREGSPRGRRRSRRSRRRRATPAGRPRALRPGRTIIRHARHHQPFVQPQGPPTSGFAGSPAAQTRTPLLSAMCKVCECSMDGEGPHRPCGPAG